MEPSSCRRNLPPKSRVASGYAVRPFHYGALLGWSAAVLAVLTAYVRVLGASLGTTHQFIGPMAKPHRMALVESVHGPPRRTACWPPLPA